MYYIKIKFINFTIWAVSRIICVNQSHIKEVYKDFTASKQEQTSFVA